MIYSKKAFFLLAIACAGTLCAITPDGDTPIYETGTENYDALRAELAQKQRALHGLMENILKQREIMYELKEKLDAIMNEMALEQKLPSKEAERGYRNYLSNELSKFCTKKIENPVLSDEFNATADLRANQIIIKILAFQIFIHERIALLMLVQEWESLASDIHKILSKIEKLH